jgi:hypothetical protein
MIRTDLPQTTHKRLRGRSSGLRLLLHEDRSLIHNWLERHGKRRHPQASRWEDRSYSDVCVPAIMAHS